MAHNPVSVDLVVDFVCPWCWLGLKNWQNAEKKRKKLQIETLIRPFQLDPSLPAEGTDYKSYMAAKFSGDKAEHWTAMRTFLDEAAPAAGIAFNFDALTHRPNTLKAHRLVRWASGQGLGLAATEALFKAFFEDLKDIGDIEVLADIADQIGMDAMVVRDLLNSDADEARVVEEEFFYRQLGVQGVPAYIFNGQFAISGAESPETLVEGIDRAAALPVVSDDA